MDTQTEITDALTIAEAVELTGFSRNTLLRRIAAGELEAVKAGKGPNSQWLITEAALAKCFPYRKRSRARAS